MKYEIYVANAKNWKDGAPDFEDFFFGGGLEYVHPIHGGHEIAGSAIADTIEEARETMASLVANGDWSNPEGDTLDPPVYAYRPLFGAWQVFAEYRENGEWRANNQGEEALGEAAGIIYLDKAIAEKAAEDLTERAGENERFEVIDY